MAVTEQQIYEVLTPIEDPELHLGIVELGLIYGIDINPQPDGGEVKLTMTFTSVFCPYGPQLRASVQHAVASLSGVKAVVVDVVFTPPWDPHTMASEECKIALGLGWEAEDDGGPDIENQR